MSQPFDIDAALDSGIALAMGRKTWGGHDRRTTVGSSEVGKCIRSVWYDKKGVPKDVHHAQDVGPLERGNAIEDWLVIRVADAIKQDPKFSDWELIWSGLDQVTFVNGNQSATPDGLLVHKKKNFSPINLEIKSQDPRIYEITTTLQVAHKLQTVQSMDLVRKKSDHKPNQAILIYVNASFVSQRRWFMVDYSSKVAEALTRRAADIMLNKKYTEKDPPPPEGINEGGKECEYCPWHERCSLREIGRLPQNSQHVPPEVQGKLHELLLRRAELRIRENESETGRKTTEQEIVDILVHHNTKRVSAPWGSVSVYKGMSPPHVDWETLDAMIGPEGVSKVRKPGTAYKRLGISLK